MNKLSICVITMNRASQLREALKSCLNCVLPDDTTFIIVDNGSTDDTEAVVKDLLSKSKYSFIYKKLEKNIGVGPGRNLCYNLSNSEYSYYLDDDAVIDETCYETFFSTALSIFDNNNCVGSITSLIKDPVTSRDPIIAKSWKVDKYPCILMYHGGSHFIRNNVYKKRNALYDNIKYGSEELSPSLYAIDNGYQNIYIPDISITHCPKINKWQKSSESLKKIIAIYCMNQYYIKKSILPIYFIPLVYLAYKIRIIKYFRDYHLPYSDSCDLTTEITLKNRIKLSTTLKLLLQFGLKVF